MVYEYKTESGVVIEKDYPVGKSPKTITVNGEKAYRVFSFSTIIDDKFQAVKTKSVR